MLLLKFAIKYLTFNVMGVRLPLFLLELLASCRLASMPECQTVRAVDFIVSANICSLHLSVCICLMYCLSDAAVVPPNDLLWISAEYIYHIYIYMYLWCICGKLSHIPTFTLTPTQLTHLIISFSSNNRKYDFPLLKAETRNRTRQLHYTSSAECFYFTLCPSPQCGRNKFNK